VRADADGLLHDLSVTIAATYPLAGHSMRMTMVLIAAVAVFAPVRAGAQTAPARTVVPFPADSTLRAIIRERVEDKRSAGIVVGVIEPSGSSRVVAYGDPGPGQPALDANSVFEIGSISKVFTATVLAQLVQEGRVKLDDPAQKYLPAAVRMPMFEGKPITLGALAVQNSGLPRLPTNLHPADLANPYADYSVQQLYDFLSSYQLPRAPGAKFEYSNLGVGLLGHILALVDGKPYEQMVRERIWTPLGMTQTAISLSPGMRQRLALGHGGKGEVVSNWDLPTLAGAGAIRSTAADMLKFADANLHPERGALHRAMAFAHEERADVGGPVRIGLNWMSLHIGADTLVFHEGATGGYRAYLGFIPTQRRAVLVLANSGSGEISDLALHLLIPGMPLAPKPAPVKQRVAITLAADALLPYVGTYQLGPGFALEVTNGADGLYVEPTGQPRLRLWAESPVDFFVKEADVQFTFNRDASGKVTGLVLHQNGANLVAPKTK
jgi:D-alanyl-D-alanine-carboxypeptidase/D-alanyl-D-alanine-endopeptidase